MCLFAYFNLSPRLHLQPWPRQRGLAHTMNGNGGGGDGETTQWLLTAEEHASLPAFQRTTEAEEAASRYRATGLVQAIGMRLKLSAGVALAAC